MDSRSLNHDEGLLYNLRQGWFTPPRIRCSDLSELFGATLKILLAFLGITILSSCSLLNDTENLRTLPHVQDFDRISINELNQTAPLPGSYNIRGYVVSVTKCPEGALCIIADGIMLYQFNDPDPSNEELRNDGIYIVIEHPEQFRVSHQYEISVQVEHERVAQASWPFATIVGYDLIR